MQDLGNPLSISGFVKPFTYDPSFVGVEDLEDNSFMTAYRYTGESKVKGTLEFIEHLLEAGQKFLLFAHHKYIMDQY
jgi:hypothetical protein